MLSIDCRMYPQVANKTSQNCSKWHSDYSDLENIDMRLRLESSLVTCNDLFSFHVLDEQLSNSPKQTNQLQARLWRVWQSLYDCKAPHASPWPFEVVDFQNPRWAFFEVHGPCWSCRSLWDHMLTHQVAEVVALFQVVDPQAPPRHNPLHSHRPWPSHGALTKDLRWQSVFIHWYYWQLDQQNSPPSDTYEDTIYS